MSLSRPGAVTLGLVLALSACESSRLSSLSSGEDSTETDAPTQSDESATGEGTTGESTTFVPNTEYPNLAECHSIEQDCPEGEKCVPYASNGGSWDANKCVPVTGSQAPGDVCVYGGVVEATDDCDASSMCWDVIELDGQMVGTCRPFCTGSEDDPMCAEGSECLIGSDATIALCIPRCDPLLQDCDEGFGCYWANNDFQCVFTTENLPPGAGCGLINDCAPGNICLTASLVPGCMDPACCTSFCSLSGGDAQCDAVPGTSCGPFFEEGMAPPGYEDVGGCWVTP